MGHGTPLSCRGLLPASSVPSTRLSAGVDPRASVEEAEDEEDVPAKQPTSGATPRIPAPHVRSCRSPSSAFAPVKGPAAPQCVIVSLGSAREIRRLRASGHRVQAGPLAMIASRDADQERTAVAFSIGRSVGNAVQRNRVRRRLREILRSRDAQGSMPASAYLVTCRAASLNLASFELAGLVDRALLSVERMSEGVGR